MSNITMAKQDMDQEKSNFLHFHGGEAQQFRVFRLAHLVNIRGGNISLALLRWESRWIYQLYNLDPRVLNEKLLFIRFYKPWKFIALYIFEGRWKELRAQNHTHKANWEEVITTEHEQ